MAALSLSTWQLGGNSGTDPDVDRLGTLDGQALVLATSGTERMRISPGGNVGIGTDAPAGRLDVGGSLSLRSLDIGDLPSGPVGTAADTVDLWSFLTIGQTTPGNTLTIPDPTNRQPGRQLVVANVGSVPFTMLGVLVNPQAGLTAVWTGGGWFRTGNG